MRISTDLMEKTAQALSVSPSTFPDALSLDDAYVAAAGGALGRAATGGAPPLYADTVAHALAAHLVTLRTPESAAASISTGLSAPTLARVVDYIRNNTANNLRVEDIAAVAHLSVFHSVRMFRISTGTTPHRYVTAVRMRRAAALLTRTNRPISLIAADVGYHSAIQFSAAFRREFGCTPTRHRADR